jgi:ferredoxin
MKNAKEKAEELVDKYFSEIRMPSDCEGCMQCVDRCGNMVDIAKKYSLIACDRTIDILKEIRDKEHSDNFWYLENAILEEMQVKREIEKL